MDGVSVQIKNAAVAVLRGVAEVANIRELQDVPDVHDVCYVREMRNALNVSGMAERRVA